MIPRTGLVCPGSLSQALQVRVWGSLVSGCLAAEALEPPRKIDLSGRNLGMGEGFPENSRQNTGGILGYRAKIGHRITAMAPGAEGSFSPRKH